MAGKPKYYPLTKIESVLFSGLRTGYISKNGPRLFNGNGKPKLTSREAGAASDRRGIHQLRTACSIKAAF
jgi:hypothetical protein